MKSVSSYTDVHELQRLMVNARRNQREDVYREAFARRCELEGIDYTDPLTREFYATLAAYEELLKEKNGRATAASYTRRKIRDKGVVQCLEDWALDTKETDGFKILVERGLITLTGEHLVLKYPEQFSAAAVSNAKRRLRKLGVNV